MRTFVTGAAGFIGSHLVERLLRDGHEVVALDDLSTGTMANLESVQSTRLRFVQGSVLDQDLVTELADSAVVFHMAAAVGVRTILENPLGALRTNMRGTETVLDAALRAAAKVVIMSSSEVYGHNISDALAEDSARILGSPLTARWSYAEAKSVDETLAHFYWRQHGLQTVIVRPFNIVGPRQTGRYGMVVPRFVDAALRNEPLTIYGDGNQTRCFCHVDEAVTAVVALANHPGAVGNVFNVGHPEEVSIGELAHRVITLTGSSSAIEHTPYPPDYPDGFEDMARRVPDVSRLYSLLGFAPEKGLEETLKSVISDRSVPGGAELRPTGVEYVAN